MYYLTPFPFYSSIWRMQKLWSVVDLFRRNPHWWSPIILSIYGLNLDKILHEVDSSDVSVYCKFTNFVFYIVTYYSFLVIHFA
jgi:hypothetical protein